MTRAEHLEWCKNKALEMCDAGYAWRALTELIKNLNKHPGTANHEASIIAISKLATGKLKSGPDIRAFIEKID